MTSKNDVCTIDSLSPMKIARKISVGNINSKKGDKKNVVKNFVKSFRGYLTTWGDKDIIKSLCDLSSYEEVKNFGKNFNKLEKKRKYNNSLIKEIM